MKTPAPRTKVKYNRGGKGPTLSNIVNVLLAR